MCLCRLAYRLYETPHSGQAKVVCVGCVMTTLHSAVVVVIVAAGSGAGLSSRDVPAAEPAPSRESSKLVMLDSNVAVDGVFGSKRLVHFFFTSFSIEN